MRRLTVALAGLGAALMPVSAFAEGKMPQMDFADPLTGAQIIWMAIIMIVLYFLLSRWALPQLGGVIADRQARIRSDLETAKRARTEAERAVTELNIAMRNAREESQSAIAASVSAAKERAREQAEAQKAELNGQLERAEAEINRARAQAMDALQPVARDVTASLVQRLTGTAPPPERIERALAASDSV